MALKKRKKKKYYCLMWIHEDGFMASGAIDTMDFIQHKSKRKKEVK